MPDLALDQTRAQPLYLTSPRLTEAGLPHLFTTRHFPGRGLAPRSRLAVRRGGAPIAGGARHPRGAAGISATGARRRRPRRRGSRTGRAGGRGRDGSPGTAARDLHGRLRAPRALRSRGPPPGARPRGVARHGGGRRRARRRARSSRRAERRRPSSARSARRSDRAATRSTSPSSSGSMPEFPGRWRAWVTATGPGKWMLDLWRANVEQLRMDGLDPARIDTWGSAPRAEPISSSRIAAGEGRGGSWPSRPCRHARIGSRDGLRDLDRYPGQPRAGAGGDRRRVPACRTLPRRRAPHRGLEDDAGRAGEGRRRGGGRRARREPRAGSQGEDRGAGPSGALAPHRRTCRRTRPRTPCSSSTASSRWTGSTWRGRSIGGRGPPAGRWTCSSRSTSARSPRRAARGPTR